MRQHRTSPPVRTVWIAVCATLMFSPSSGVAQDSKKPASLEDGATSGPKSAASKAEDKPQADGQPKVDGNSKADSASKAASSSKPDSASKAASSSKPDSASKAASSSKPDSASKAASSSKGDKSKAEDRDGVEDESPASPDDISKPSKTGQSTSADSLAGIPDAVPSAKPLAGAPRPPVRADAPEPPPPTSHSTWATLPPRGATASTEEATDPDEEAKLASELAPDKRVLQLQLGLRSMYVTESAYDPFAKHDALVSIGAALSYSVWGYGKFSIAPFVLWDYGSTGDTARGKDSSLSVHRVEVGVEGRYHFTPWLYGYARIAPGALCRTIALKDDSGSPELDQSVWTFALDSAAGAAALLGPRRASTKFRFWGFGEGGYAWSERRSIVLAPAARDDQAPVGDLNLGRLALRGGHFRLGLAVTY